MGYRCKPRPQPIGVVRRGQRGLPRRHDFRALFAALSTAPCGSAAVPQGLGSGSPRPHLRRDWAHPAHICAGTGLTPPTSAPGLGPPRSHLRRDWAAAHPAHICAGTGLTPPNAAERRRSVARVSESACCFAAPVALHVACVSICFEAAAAWYSHSARCARLRSVCLFVDCVFCAACRVRAAACDTTLRSIAPLPHLHRNWAHPCHICTGTALAPATSAPGLRSPLPHLQRDWAHHCHICTGTGLTPATSAPGLSRMCCFVRRYFLLENMRWPITLT
jgi:hypothetical protein